MKGNAFKSQVTYEKVEANVPLDDSLFRMPAASAQQPGKSPDASKTQPKKPEGKEPNTKPRENRDK